VSTTHCIVCDNLVFRARRTLPEGRVCNACYQREFRPVACAECGRPTTSRHGATPAYCSVCRPAPRPQCVRCARTVRPWSLLTPAGLVCTRCKRHFVEPKPCGKCGRLSTRLSGSVLAPPGTRVCGPCAAADRRTCSVCRKHRKVEHWTDASQPVCLRCASGTAFRCEVCGEQDPALYHSRTRCKRCYVATVLRLNARAISEALPSGWARTAFDSFCEHVITNSPDAKITWRNRLRGYGRMFDSLGKNFASPANVTPERMLAVFGTDELRRQQVPYAWLINNHFVEPVNSQKLAEDSETRAQERVIARVSEAWKQSLLRRYLAFLGRMKSAWRKRGWSGDHERYRDRSVTLMLRAAWRFLEELPDEVLSTQGIDQEQVNRFMARFPGHVNALHSFVNYLNTKETLFQKLRLSRARAPEGRAVERILTGERARELLQLWLAADDKGRPVALMCLFMLVYARNAKQAVSLRRKHFEVLKSGQIRARFGSVAVPLAPEIASLLAEHLADRERTLGRTLEDDEFIFPGRLPDRSYSETALFYRLGKHDVTARQLYATAVASFFSAGLESPKVLVKALGISDQTAIEYRRTVAPRVVEEMEQRAGRR
jgi:hypothetical protein